MTVIRITGAGGCIDNEVVIIANVFRSLGYEVSVENPWTKAGVLPSKAEMDKTVSHVVNWNKNPPKNGDYSCGKLSVHIVADHIPWGG